MSLAQYTDYEIEDFRLCRNSPIYFINKHFTIIHPTNGKMIAKLYPAQERLVWAYHLNQHNITLSSRQSGATLCMVGYALWAALFAKDRFNVVLVSNRKADANQIIRLFRFAIDNLPHWLKPKLDVDNKNQISFYNERVKIIAKAVTEDACRGLSVDLFLWDNAMFSREQAAHDMWYSMIPSVLPNNGRTIVTSSGTKSLKENESNLFCELWYGAIKQTNGLALNLLRWDEIPGRDDEFKRRTIELLGENAWRREYECEFVFEE